MFCKNCGAEITSSTLYCSSCGQSINDASASSTNYENTNNASDGDNLHVGWMLASLIIPIVGFIIFFNLKNTYPKKAQQALIIGIISFVLNLILMAGG